MARMNIEISAGVAWRLTLAVSDDRRYRDLAALATYLLVGPRRPCAAGRGQLAGPACLGEDDCGKGDGSRRRKAED